LVTVTVTPVNDLPVAVDDTFTIDEDSPAAPLDVLANDTDVEGALTVIEVTPPINGTIGLVGGVVSYRPNPDFAGTDSFTYTVTDTDAETATGVVSINVTNINDAPVAVDQSLGVPENAGTTITLTATDVDSSVTFAIET